MSIGVDGKSDAPALPRWWVEWYGAKRPLICYSIRFLGVITLLYAFSLLAIYQKILVHATVTYAVLAHVLIQSLGGNSSREGATLLSGPDAIITVKPFCTAFDYAWFLIAAIVAFPAPSAKRMIGLTIGLAFLFFLNVLRISSLHLTGVLHPQNFNFMHEQFWAFFLNLYTVCGVVLWMVWIKRTDRHEN